MNTPANAGPELETPAAPAPLSATRPLAWSIRREIWENRSLYVAPLVVAGLVLLGCLIATMTLPHRARTMEPAKLQVAMALPYQMAPAPIMLAAMLVGVFYALDALYGERRDRSILFWKSLPVSDLTVVLSKACVVLGVLPLIALALGVVTQLLVLLLSAAILGASGLSTAPLWANLAFLQEPLVQVYGLGVHMLWYAPIYCWLLLVSAWARRTPLLWAVLPPPALVAIERVAFQTSHTCTWMKYRLAGAMERGFNIPPGTHNAGLAHLDPWEFLTTPGLWLGLVAAAAFLAAAARLRRRREPI